VHRDHVMLKTPFPVGAIRATVKVAGKFFRFATLVRRVIVQGGTMFVESPAGRARIAFCI